MINMNCLLFFSKKVNEIAIEMVVGFSILDLPLALFKTHVETLLGSIFNNELHSVSERASCTALHRTRRSKSTSQTVINYRIPTPCSNSISNTCVKSIDLDSALSPLFRPFLLTFFVRKLGNLCFKNNLFG